MGRMVAGWTRFEGRNVRSSASEQNCPTAFVDYGTHHSQNIVCFPKLHFEEHGGIIAHGFYFERFAINQQRLIGLFGFD